MGGILDQGSTRGRTILGITGLALVLASALDDKLLPACDAHALFGVAMFKPAALFVVGVAGMVFMGTAALELLEERTGWLSRWCQSKWILYLSRGILWIYLADLVVGADVSRFFMQTARTPKAAALLVAALIPTSLVVAYGIGALRVRTMARRDNRAHPGAG